MTTRGHKNCHRADVKGRRQPAIRRTKRPPMRNPHPWERIKIKGE